MATFFNGAALIGAVMLLFPNFSDAQFGCELNFAHTGNLQSWTVPNGVTTIRLEAAGAEGGYSNDGPCYQGGLGATVAGDFSVSPGETLQIIVAGKGTDDFGTVIGTGGGGATFIARGSNGFSDFVAGNILLIGGGGGGAFLSR